MVNPNKINDEIRIQLESPYNKYFITNNGKIFCYKKSIDVFKELKPFLVGEYLGIDLCNGHGKGKRIHIHKLVAENFVENKLNKPYINHKDGNKLNNFYSNLEWVTCSENMIHASNNGLLRIGSSCNLSKLLEDDVINIKKRIKRGEKLTLIAKDYGVTGGLISMIKTGKCWRQINDQ